MAPENTTDSVPIAELEIQVEFAVADYYRVLLWRMLFGRRWTLPLVIAATILVAIAETLPITDNIDVAAHAVFAVLLLIYLAFILACPYLSARRILKDFASRRYRYNFSLSAIKAEGVNSSACIGWADVKSADETGRYLILNLRGGSLLALPKRSMEADRLPLLRLMVRNAIGTRAKLR